MSVMSPAGPGSLEPPAGRRGSSEDTSLLTETDPAHSDQTGTDRQAQLV